MYKMLWCSTESNLALVSRCQTPPLSDIGTAGRLLPAVPISERGGVWQRETNLALQHHKCRKAYIPGTGAPRWWCGRGGGTVAASLSSMSSKSSSSSLSSALKSSARRSISDSVMGAGV